MELITRQIINKNISITSVRLDDNNSIVEQYTDYSTLILKINIAKNYLISQRNCRPGQKVIIANFYWPEYLAWIFACAELGINFVISDYPKTAIALQKLSVYGEIDYIIWDHHYPPGFAEFPNKLINSNDVFKNYVNEADTPIWATPSSIFMLATSSGTTGTPKVISHTHEFFYKLLERNATLYNLKDSDKCFHSKGLHHGSVMGVYFLPSIKYCSNHYHAPFKFIPCDGVDTDEFIQYWVDLIQKEKINRCLMFYDQIEYLNKFINFDNKRHDDFLIFALAKVQPNIIENIVGKFNYRIQSIFGCTETSGPLFLPEINVTNYKNFDPMDYGTPLDNFYKFDLTDNNLLEVTMPDGSKTLTGDKFKIDNDRFMFYGRENLYRIRGSTIYLDLLNDVIEKVSNLLREKDFDIIVDNEYHLIYIRVTTDLDLSILNQGIISELGIDYYEISKKIVGDRNQFFSGIKFDPETVRLMCRQL